MSLSHDLHHQAPFSRNSLPPRLDLTQDLKTRLAQLFRAENTRERYILHFISSQPLSPTYSSALEAYQPRQLQHPFFQRNHHLSVDPGIPVCGRCYKDRE